MLFFPQPLRNSIGPWKPIKAKDKNVPVLVFQENAIIAPFREIFN